MIVCSAIVSAASNDRTPTVITPQYRLNHEVYPRSSSRCWHNRCLIRSRFPRPLFGALLKALRRFFLAQRTWPFTEAVNGAGVVA